MELSKLAELNDSGGGYDWAWQKEAKALKEKVEAAGAAGASAEDGDAKAALKLSMDNILMVGRVAARQCRKREILFGQCARGFQIYFRQSTTIVSIRLSVDVTININNLRACLSYGTPRLPVYKSCY